MKWKKEWGGNEKGLLIVQKNFGRPIDALTRKPNLPWYYEVFLQHFFTLSFSRTKYLSSTVKNKQQVFIESLNPIDVATIIQYCYVITLTVSIEDFISIVQVLDDTYLNWKPGDD